MNSLFSPPTRRKNSTISLLPPVAESKESLSPGIQGRTLQEVSGSGGIIASPQVTGRRLGDITKSPAVETRALKRGATQAGGGAIAASEQQSPVSGASSISIASSTSTESLVSTASSISIASSSSAEPENKPTQKSPSLIVRSASFSVPDKSRTFFYSPAVSKVVTEKVVTEVEETKSVAVSASSKSPSKSPRTVARRASDSQLLDPKVRRFQQKIAEIKEYYPQLEKETLSFLIVEDNPVNQKLLKNRLMSSWNALKLGIKILITTAGDGAEGVDAYKEKLKEKPKEEPKEEPYDIIFMDMQMPVMDGEEATKNIRALEKTKASKGHRAFILSTTENKEIRQKCLDKLAASLTEELPLYDGVNGIISDNSSTTKQVNKESLVDYIHAHLTNMLARKHAAEAKASHSITAKPSNSSLPTVNPPQENGYNMPLHINCLIM